MRRPAVRVPVACPRDLELVEQPREAGAVRGSAIRRAVRSSDQDDPGAVVAVGAGGPAASAVLAG